MEEYHDLQQMTATKTKLLLLIILWTGVRLLFWREFYLLAERITKYILKCEARMILYNMLSHSITHLLESTKKPTNPRNMFEGHHLRV
jgi:hypothetical protein